MGGITIWVACAGFMVLINILTTIRQQHNSDRLDDILDDIWPSLKPGIKESNGPSNNI
jgi:hypothetical protein